ncbi:hypothetical protein CDAR_171541 [Caerostris darwini]|uniref:Uncharacterized protein n=1 Tax=Caerostris darwini TaxID=1538125 RepID=A0AAV4WP52_9ARAC|nr:hypothetical protein CDAR_171541 [Caerostris darwini]
MTKQGSVVRTTWSHNALVSPRCTPAPTFKRSKEEVRVPLAFLIESFHGVVRIQRRISRFISAFVSALSHCSGKDLQMDFKLQTISLIPLCCNRVGLGDKVKFFPDPMTKQGSVVRTTWSHNSLVSPRCTFAPTFKRSKEEVRAPLAFLIESFHGVVRIQRRISRVISGFVLGSITLLGEGPSKVF